MHRSSSFCEGSWGPVPARRSPRYSCSCRSFMPASEIILLRQACGRSRVRFVLCFGLQPAIEISNADQADAEANERSCPPQAFQVAEIEQEDLENRKPDDGKCC